MGYTFYDSILNSVYGNQTLDGNIYNYPELQISFSTSSDPKDKVTYDTVNDGNNSSSPSTIKVEQATKIKPEEVKSYTRKGDGFKSGNKVDINSDVVDKRVSLNVAPIKRGFAFVKESIVDRLDYVLGYASYKPKDVTLYGYLRALLSESVGLIFPYTPTITMNHKVNYDSTEILHSNLTLHHYKNTPNPTIGINNITFTADTEENARLMLGAIWFLRACTKCEYGEYASRYDVGGMPPPILYLNGWGHMFDNIPVIINTADFTYGNSVDYVELKLNMSNPNSVTNEIISYLNGGDINYTNNDYQYTFWLPSELTINLSLSIQPNVEKYVKTFDLNQYKMGILGLNSVEQTKAIKTFSMQNLGTMIGQSPYEVDLDYDQTMVELKKISGGNRADVIERLDELKGLDEMPKLITRRNGAIAMTKSEIQRVQNEFAQYQAIKKYLQDNNIATSVDEHWWKKNDYSFKQTKTKDTLITSYKLSSETKNQLKKFNKSGWTW